MVYRPLLTHTRLADAAGTTCGWSKGRGAFPYKRLKDSYLSPHRFTFAEILRRE